MTEDYITFSAELKGLKGKDKTSQVNKVINEVESLMLKTVLSVIFPRVIDNE